MRTYLSTFVLGLNLIAFSLFPNPGLALPVASTQRSPQTVLQQLFNSRNLEATWFSPLVLEKVPLSRLQAALDALKINVRSDLGDYRSVQKINADQYQVLFEKGSVLATIRLDLEGRIALIGFGDPKKF